MLKLDLMQLETPERFQMLCARLARKEFPNALATSFASWDGGRDILHFSELADGKLVHHAVWQAKFTDDLGSNTKKSIKESIATITKRRDIEVRRWILCLPVDPTGKFFDWLAKEVAVAGWAPEIWGKSVLLEKLEHTSLKRSSGRPSRSCAAISASTISNSSTSSSTHGVSGHKPTRKHSSFIALEMWRRPISSSI